MFVHLFSVDGKLNANFALVGIISCGIVRPSTSSTRLPEPLWSHFFSQTKSFDIRVVTYILFSDSNSYPTYRKRSRVVNGIVSVENCHHIIVIDDVYYKHERSYLSSRLNQFISKYKRPAYVSRKVKIVCVVVGYCQRIEAWISV